MNDTSLLLPHIKLRFNIEHPSLEECYIYGYECGVAEVDEESNPYPHGTSEYEQWAEGWWDGLYVDKPVFALDEEQDDSTIQESPAANDQVYHEQKDTFFVKLLEISGMIAVSAIVGYQIIELVA